MPRLQILLECVARATLERGLPLPDPSVPLGKLLLPLAERTHQLIHSQLPPDEIRTALREAVASPLETVELCLRDAIHRASEGKTGIESGRLISFLELVPPTIRQFLRRPDDIAGQSVPEQLTFQTPDDWLPLLPDRRERFHAGDKPKDLDNWQLTDLRGFGSAGETWRGWDDKAPDHQPVCLKFINEPGPRQTLEHLQDYLQQIIDLPPISGLVQLRSVYLESDPPCLEWDYYSGYDLGGLIRDWRWRYQKTRPGHAAMIIRRIAKVLGRLHTLDTPLVHRGIKPSNILLHPTSDGKVSIWISDMGWSVISSVYALKNGCEARAKRQTRLGSHTAGYASPQQKRGDRAIPQDDIYSLGVVWYQLLQRDSSALPPGGNAWTMEFRSLGFSDAQAMVLASCLSPDPKDRPANGLILADLIDKNAANTLDDGSKTFRLKGTTTSLKPLLSTSAEGSPVEKPPLIWPLREEPRAFQNSLGIQFALIPAGTFQMGSPDHEKGRQPCEGPVHKVTISRPFYLGIFPITQTQYRALTGKNPAHFQSTLGGGPDHPVEQVNWEEAVEYCERLNRLPEEVKHSRLYRLPTEAEWEYACRAGTSMRYAFGDEVSLSEVHFFGLSPLTWAKEAGSVGKTQKVGIHRPNAWGLYDMHGNILEWCADWWSEDFYLESPDTDPTGPSEGWQHVVRGGSFSQFEKECRSASRFGRPPKSRLNTVGFRIALTIPGA